MTDSTSFSADGTHNVGDSGSGGTQIAEAGHSIEVAEPKAEWTVIQHIAPGEALSLNFDPAAVASAEIKDGNLEIKFSNGSTAVVEGYQAWADAGGQATGPQGGAVDMAQLLGHGAPAVEPAAPAPDEATQQAAAQPTEPQVCAIPGTNVVEVPTPQAGETITVAVAPGDALQLACDMKDVKGMEVGDTMHLTFPTGGVVIVDNFDQWAAAKGATVTDCVCGGGNLADFIVAIGLNPEDVLPAAGGGGPAGALPSDHNGAAFTPHAGPEFLGGLPYPHILPPTALNYGVPEPEQTFFPVNEEKDNGVPDAHDDPGPDNPPRGGNEEGCVDERGLIDGGEGGGDIAQKGDPSLLTVSGNILANDSFGPDGPGGIVGVTYTGDLDVTVTGPDADGVMVFTSDFWVMTIDIAGANAGNYEFTLTAPYPHTGQGADEALEPFKYTIEDKDGDQDSATLTICIDDDVPTVLEPSNTVVEEDNLPGGNDENPLITDHATGSLGVDFGADGPGDITAAKYEGPQLFSAGEKVTFAFDEATNTLTGFVDTDNDGKIDAGEREVITVEFDPTSGPNGEYNVTLLGQLDHPLNNKDDEEALNLKIDFTVTDGDGDKADGSLNVQVLDDLPKVVGERINVTVEEDDLNNAQGKGNNEDGSSGKTVATGDLSTLVSAGADQPATFGFGSDFSGLVAQNLKSGGDALSYSVTGDTLTGFVDGNGNGKADAGEAVFTMQVQSDGKFTFTLIDQLDHADNGLNDENTLNIDFSSVITAADKDKDTISLGQGTVTVTVVDDIPVPTGKSLNVIVEEDDINNAQSVGNNEDKSTGKDVATGTLTGLVSVGADEPASFAIGKDLSGIEGQGLTSAGNALSYVVDGDTLTGFVDANKDGKADDGEKVFTLQVESDGDFKFTLIDQLDHAKGGGENDLKIDFSSLITATDKDGDELTLAGGEGGAFTVTVQDDIPVLTGKQVSATVEEDDLNNKQSVGNNEDKSVGHDVATGSLAAAVSVGTDEPATFAFGADLAGLTSQNLKSGGNALSYVVDGDTLTGFVDSNKDGKAEDGEKVFTLQVESDGDFKFTLIDQLDHADNGKNDENTLNIDFSSIVTASDKDGDEIGLGKGTFTVTVQDDVPVLTGKQVSVTVEEDDLKNSQSTGNNEDGSSGKDVATGTLAGAVSVGADEPAAFAFGTDLSGLTAQNLKSGGSALSYIVDGDTLTGFVDANKDGKAEDGEKVFTLQVESDGDFKFTLIDQLDHEAGKGENDLKIDFSSLITATDKDGDDLALGKGTFTVTVQDDVPVLTGKQVSVTVEEDDLNNAQGKGNNEDGSSGKDVATGSLAAAVSVGADEPATFAFGKDLSSLAAQNLKSGGNALTYVVDGDTLTGFVDTDKDGKADDGEKVFTLQVESDGDFKFTLIDQLDHAKGGGENFLDIDFSKVVTATDKDGDSITLSGGEGGFTVTVQDDIPVISGSKTNVKVEEDDLNNAQGKGNNEDNSTGHDVASGKLAAAVSPGADEPATFGLGTDVSGLTSQGLTSAGNALSYVVDGNTLTGFVDTDKDGKADDGEKVFTLQLDSDGSFKFTLIDQLDHAKGGGENTLDIDLSSMVVATDKDGDQVGLGKGTFTVTVEDDVPVLNGDKTVSATVEEDDINNSQSVGNNEDLSSGKNIATGAAGTLSALVSVGADEPATFGLKTVATAVDSGLNSQGKDVVILSDGNTLTGFVDVNSDGKLDGGDRQVFTLSVGADGSYKFELKDQVDHTDNGKNDENLLDTALDLSTFVTATDKDGDQVSLGKGQFTIQIQDDVPVLTGKQVSVTVEEDDLNNAQSVGNNEDKSVGKDVATGSLAGTVSVGTDEPAAFTFGTDFSGLTGQGLKSGGEALSYAVTGDTLTGFIDTDKDGQVDAGERQVFTLQVGGDGNFKFTLKDQLDHVDNGKNDENNLTIDFSSVVAASDKDGDDLKLGNGTFTVVVQDDVPVLTGKQVSATVEEDDLNNAQSKGNNEDGSSGKDVATGSLGSVVAVGADEPAVFTFGTDFSGLTGQGLKSGGEALSYAVTGDTLTGFIDTDKDGQVDAGERQVFTLQVGGDGNFKFTLKDQLDHVDNGKNDENNLTIDFSSVVTASDKDGDDLKLGNGTFTVVVQDDVPVLTGKQVSVTVEEDDLNNKQSVGNNEDKSVGHDVATGSLAGAVSVGADEPAAFTFGTDFSGLTGQGLKSGGEALSYAVTGDTLTGFIDTDKDGSVDAGERQVFTLQVGTDGNFKFTLLDQLDHEAGKGENDLKIDFSSVVQASDKDGDDLKLGGGTFTVTVQDDIPEQNNNTLIVAVEEEALPGGIQELGDPTPDTTVATGSVANLVSVGADEPASFSVNNDFTALTSQSLTSDGKALSYSVSGDTLTGFVDANNDKVAQDGEKVFTFQVKSDGNFTFTLLDHLDHAKGGGENTLGIDLSSVVKATDKDGDSILLDSKSITVNVVDDVPLAADDTAGVGQKPVLNLTIIFDRSGSMDEDPGVPGFSTRIDLERAAVASLLSAYGSVATLNILIVDFSGSADNSGWLVGINSIQDANAYLAQLEANGTTNYNAAINETKSAYVVGTPTADQSFVYFLSDGKPNPASSSLDGTANGDGPSNGGANLPQTDAWEQFLINNHIAKAFAVGVGQGVTGANVDLGEIAFPDGDKNNPIIIDSNEGAIFDALVGTIEPIVAGNVLTGIVNDQFGADGPGVPQVTQFVHNGVTYTPGSAVGGTVVSNDGHTIVIHTLLGADFTFNFDTGAYKYEGGTAGPGGSTEQFLYTIQDADGDTSSATLTVDLSTIVVEQPNRIFGANDKNDNLVGTDSAPGHNGADILAGGDGNDTLDGKNGIDYLIGGAGADSLLGGDGNDVIVGGSTGEKTNGDVRAADLGDTIDGGSGNDFVNAGAGDDVVRGGSGDDMLLGGIGNDTIQGGTGNDTIQGGDGNDLIDWSDATGAISHTLGAGGSGSANLTGVGLGTDSYTGIQGIVGSNFNDTLTGNGSDNTIDGGAGNDSLNGGDGKDVILGGSGDDNITGGLNDDTVTGGLGNDTMDAADGNDVFQYTSKLDGHDVIQNFDGNSSGGQDVLNLDSLFDSLGVATAARDARTNIVDNGATVDVQVDTDNNGSFDLTVATLNTTDTITKGADVLLGTL